MPTDDSWHATRRKVAVVGILAIVGLLAVVHYLLQDTYITLIVASCCVWLVAAFNMPVSPEWNLSAVKVYLPIFCAYSAIGLCTGSLNHFSTLLFCTVASALAFTLGWNIAAPGKGFDKRQPTQIEAAVNGHFRMPLVWLVLWVTLAIYAACAVYAGGLPAFAEDSNQARTEFYPSGYVGMFVVMGIHILSFVGIVTLSTLKQRRWSGFIFTFVAVTLALGTANRGVIFIPLLLAGIYLAYVRRINLLRLVPIFILGLGLFSYLGIQRSSSSNGAYEYSQYLRRLGFEGGAQYMAPVMRYIRSTMETFDTSISYFPQLHDFAYGTQFFSPLLLKQSVDLWIKDVFGATFEGFGLALGSMNALYVDWGLPGVVLGAFLFGATTGYAFFRAIKTGQHRWIFLYSFILMHLLLSIYGHPFAYLYYVVEPAILWIIIKPSTLTIEPPTIVANRTGAPQNK